MLSSRKLPAARYADSQEVEKYPAAQRLMTHPGVSALTALAYVLIIGEPERFERGKQIAAYLGLVPEEDSSGKGAGWDTGRIKQPDLVP